MVLSLSSVFSGFHQTLQLSSVTISITTTTSFKTFHNLLINLSHNATIFSQRLHHTNPQKRKRPWSVTKCRGADKSLDRLGRKQARKRVRDASDFNNIETANYHRVPPTATQGAEGNSRHSDRNISLFPVQAGLRTCQHPCTIPVPGYRD